MASSKPVKCSAKSAQNVDCCGQDACAATTSQASPSGSMLLELNTAVLEGRTAALIGERPVVRRYEGNHPSRRSHSKSLQRWIQSTQLEPIPGGNPRPPRSSWLPPLSTAAYLDCESRFVKSFRQGELGCIVACLTWSWHFWTSRLDFAVDLFESIRRSAGWT